MKNLAILLFCLCTFSSCVTTSLYSWNNYEDTSYLYYKHQTPEAKADLLATYEKMINKQTGTRKTVPPGIYSEYGFLLLENGNTEEGLAALKNEIKLYPASKTYVERIIKLKEK